MYLTSIVSDNKESKVAGFTIDLVLVQHEVYDFLSGHQRCHPHGHLAAKGRREETSLSVVVMAVDGTSEQNNITVTNYYDRQILYYMIID